MMEASQAITSQSLRAFVFPVLREYSWIVSVTFKDTRIAANSCLQLRKFLQNAWAGMPLRISLRLPLRVVWNSGSCQSMWRIAWMKKGEGVVVIFRSGFVGVIPESDNQPCALRRNLQEKKQHVVQIRPLSLRELFLVRYSVHGLADGFVVRYGFARAPTQARACVRACACVASGRVV